MDQSENYFLSHNKLLEEKLDYCIHNIETRLDKLCEQTVYRYTTDKEHNKVSKNLSPYSNYTYLQFKSPYIRDFRNFGGPANDDVRQIRELTGTENIDVLIKHKSWSKDTIQQLENAVLDYYSRAHILELIKQKNLLSKQMQDMPPANRPDIEQKMSLIDEQIEQVKSRKDQRIFVPDDRSSPNVDWCAVSAKLANTHHDAQDCRLMWSNKLHWTINNGPWTKEEDECLVRAVQKFGKNDWDTVAKELNSNRLPWQCCSRYHQELTHSYCGSTPILEDDADKIIEIINLCRIGNYVPWNQVMYFIKYHSLLQVKYQWHKLISEKKSNQLWTRQEDALLLKFVDKFGDKDWNRISNYVPGRSNKSCRERYTMRLKFQKRAVGNWRKKEDENLLKFIERFGTNWSLISKHFSERNSHQLRNRYELLKNEATRMGPIRHKKLYRNADGFLVSLHGRRQKPPSDREVDEKLSEIFSTYQNVKASTKLICRSLQDEMIYQNLIQVICALITGKEFTKTTLLGEIIEKAMKERVTLNNELFTPCVATIQGFRAWKMQQDYLSQFEDPSYDWDTITSTSEYHETLKIVMSFFIWPAILSKLKRPNVNASDFQVGSIIEKDVKNLYKIRGIQKQIASLNRDK